MAAAMWQGQAPIASHETLLMVFIGIAAAALLGQALVMVVLAFGAAKTQKQLDAHLVEIKAKLLPLLDKSSALVTDVTPQIKQVAAKATAISGHVEDISCLLREKMHEFGPTISAANQVLSEANDTVKDANLKTREQVARANGMVTDVLDATTQVGKAIQHGISIPVREVSSILGGMKVAFYTFLNGNARPKPPVYRAPVGTYEPTEYSSESNLYPGPKQ